MKTMVAIPTVVVGAEMEDMLHMEAEGAAEVEVEVAID